MAIQSVEHAPASAWHLPFDDVNAINDLAHKVRGILTTLRLAAGSATELSQDAISGATWAAEDLVTEMEALATKKRNAP